MNRRWGGWGVGWAAEVTCGDDAVTTGRLKGEPVDDKIGGNDDSGRKADGG